MLREKMLGRRQKTFTKVTTTAASITLDNKSGLVTEAAWKTGYPIAIVGVEIYLSGPYIVDVASATRKTGLGRIVHVEQFD